MSKKDILVGVKVLPCPITDREMRIREMAPRMFDALERMAENAEGVRGKAASSFYKEMFAIVDFVNKRRSK